ncbi:hypothetical protein AB0B30_22500 [Streptomyces narbonensis]|uniref:Uncharacterized protein n=1 Tax=Streptomyces narbonensis TaxID=67333 RepID=A0ABV3C949_9ACTN
MSKRFDSMVDGAPGLRPARSTSTTAAARRPLGRRMSWRVP